MERPTDDQLSADALHRAMVSTSCCWRGMGPREWSLGPLRDPLGGDLLLVEVVEPGYMFGDGLLEVHAENNGTDTRSLRVGSQFVGSLGDREADDEWSAQMPQRFSEPAPILDLVAGCGLLSLVTDNHVGEQPTRVRVLGAVHSGGRPVTTRVERMVRPEPDLASRVIVFVADKMNAGKSTAVLACTRALKSKREMIAVGKITGTARRRGLAAALQSGAQVGQSFADFGYASTKNIPLDDLERIFHCIRDGLRAEASGGYVLLELADGFEQTETAAVLKLMAKHPVGQVVLCLSGNTGPLQSVEGYRAFCAAYGAPDYISGCLAGKPEHVAALRAEPGVHAIPMFDALHTDEDELGVLLASMARDAD